MANISGSSEARTNLPAAVVAADGASNPTASIFQTFGSRYNGSTWDREYGNTVLLTALAMAARTGSTLSGALVNPTGKGILLLLNVSAVGTGQIGSMEIYDGSANFLFYQFGTLGINTTGFRQFLIYPGAATAGSFTAAPIQGIIPHDFQVQVSWPGGNTGSLTFDLKYHLIG